MKLVSIAEVRMRKTLSKAQMAESVDALVSNTSGATRAGSTPALGTFQKVCCYMATHFFFVFMLQFRRKVVLLQEIQSRIKHYG